MKSILHVIDTGGPGGAETVFAEIAIGLRDRGYRSGAIVSREGWLAERLRGSGLSPYVVSASGSFNVAYLRRLRAIAIAEQAEIVIAHLLGSVVYSALMSFGTRMQVLGVFHGPSDLPAGSSLNRLKAWIIDHRCKRAVAVSDALRNKLETELGLAPSGVMTIYNGIDVHRFAPQPERSLREELSIPEATILVGALGNIRAPKGYDVLLSAAAKLRESGRDFSFVIVGEPDRPGALMRELEDLRARLDLTDRVTFLGFRSDTAHVLNSLDLFVLPSRTEGFSLACVEAMACGLPIVATRSGGPVELLGPERAGVLVEPGDPDALARAILMVASDPQLSGELKQRARDAAVRRFSVSAMLDAYERLIQTL